MDKELIIGEEALHESLDRCAKGVRWKATTAHYRHNWPEEVDRLSRQLRNGSYRERKPRKFMVTEPKRREIMSIHFRDRIFQRSLNDVGIYPQVSRSFIEENYACQTGKGTQKARDRLQELLRRHYRKHGTAGYVLKIDIAGYYPNMDHGYAEAMLESYLDETTYQMAKQVLSHLPGDVGYNPGSQIVQLVGITALDKIDHYAKERLRVPYIRYMDDFILISREKEHLEHCLRDIEARLKKAKMALNTKKTFIQPISDPILFLGFLFRLTDTGKVVVLADPQKIKHEKKKLVRMIALVRKGTLTKREVDQHFKAYKACVRYGNSHTLIRRLNVWYAAQWENGGGHGQSGHC